MQDMQPNQLDAQPGTGGDREGAMARADLYKLANYSLKLFKQLDDNTQLESWVQAKITKAADYVASVYHYLEYEMKFSEYAHQLDTAEMVAEGTKVELKNKLLEAKAKIAELKKAQAEKQTGLEEGIISGGEEPCAECGGTGVVHRDPTPIPAHVKGKVAAYNRQAKAMHAASKRIDRNKNGIPDDEEATDEGFEAGAKPGSTFKTKTGVATKTKTGLVHQNTSHSDEEHGEPPSKVKSRSAADKAGDKAAEKEADRDYKAAKKANPAGVRRYKDGKQVDEVFGQGVYEGKADKDYDGDGEVESDKDEVWGSRAKAAAKSGKGFGKDKKVDETLKGKQKELDTDKDGDIEADDLADLRAGKKVDEGKPSAGLSKAKKSAVVKKAKAGGDIGKPGKSFDKVAKAAGGGEKGEKIAAAAMWKNIKESVQTTEPAQPEVIAESADLVRMKQFLTRLNG